MKSSNLIISGISVIIILIAGGLIFPNSPFNLLDSQDIHLSQEEAVSIALQDGKASVFVRQNQALSHSDFNSGIWIIKFEAIQQPDNFVLVRVEDKSGLILDSVSSQETMNLAENRANQEDYQSGNPNQDFGVHGEGMFAADYRYGGVEDYYYLGNQEQVEAAIEYFRENQIVKQSIIDNSIDFYGYSYENTIYLWGYKIDNYQEWMNVIIFDQDVRQDTWSFSISEISSSFIFGNPILSFAETVVIAESTDEFAIFKENITEYQSSPVLHFEIDPQSSMGRYIFKIHYSSYFDYCCGIVNEGATTGSDVSPTSEYGIQSEVFASEETIADAEYRYWGSNNWIEIEIDDATGTVLDIWGPDSALLQAEEVLALLKSEPKIQGWTHHIGDLVNYTYYDGYGNWWVSMYDTEDYYNYACAQVNDRSLEVSNIHTYLAIPAKLADAEVANLVETYDEAMEFFNRAVNFEYYFYYDHYGQWYVSYYDQDNYFNYMWGSVNDSDGSVIYLEVKLYQKPQLSEVEVLEILKTTGLDEFKETYPQVVLSTYYNGYDTWYVYAYSLILIEAWLWAEISDDTSAIISSGENHPEVLPTRSLNQVVAIAHSTDEFKEIIKKIDQHFEYYYFYNGVWYYYMQGTSEDGFYYWLSISIDDKTAELIDIWSSSWNYVFEDDPMDIEVEGTSTQS